MTNWLNRLIRAPRTRGFGVQSPTDYHFIRHVVRQQFPYYAYNTLSSKTTHLSKREVELLQFYLRLANYIQDRWQLYIIGKDNLGAIDTNLRTLYLKAGSKKVKAVQTSRLPSNLSSQTSVLIVENLAYNKSVIKECAEATVIFDMEDIAVVFCDPKRFKTIYKINL